MNQTPGGVLGRRARGWAGIAVAALAARLACVAPEVWAANGDVLRISAVLDSRSPTDLTFRPGAGDGSLWASTRIDGKLYELNLSLDEVLRVIDNPHGVAPFPNVILSWGVAYRPASDTLFVLAQMGMAWSIKEVRTDGSVVEGSAFTVEPPDPATSNLRGLTFDPTSGQLWYLDVNNDLCVRTDLSGSPSATLPLPADDPPSTILPGAGLAFFSQSNQPRLYVAYGEVSRSIPSQILQLTLDGVETGVHVPLTGVPDAEGFRGFELYRVGPGTRVAQITAAGSIVEIEHTVPETIPPSQLRCHLTTANHVALSWQNHGRAGNGAYAGEIVVLRGGSPVTTVPGTTTAFVDTSPPPGTSSYALQAAEEPGGEPSPPSFPCEVTVGPGGLVARVTFAGKSPYDIARDPRQGDLYITDPDGGTIYRYDAALQPLGEVPSPVVDPGAIAFIPTIDIETLAVPGEDPSFTTLENVLAVGRLDSSLVSILTLDGDVKTTLSFELSGGVLGGLTWIPESQEFAAVELTTRERLVIGRSGRLVDRCFPRSLLPPLPLSEDEQLNFGITYDVIQGTFLSFHDDGRVRELFRDVDTQGGCVVTDFSFDLEGVGISSEPERSLRGIQIAGSTLIVCASESNEILQVLVHPFTTEFRRGDADRDGDVTLTDAVRIAAYLFRPGSALLDCLDAADTNDDGTLDVSDPVYLLFYLFKQGPAPPVPFDEAGTDPTFRDNLGCGE